MFVLSFLRDISIPTFLHSYSHDVHYSDIVLFTVHTYALSLICGYVVE